MFVYIHIPFCRRKCSYCKFVIIPDPAPALVAHYTVHLISEIETSLVHEWRRDESIESIYFGGGTPSLLPASTIEKIIETFRHTRPCAPDAEITIECHPEDISAEYLEDLAYIGINRVSIGIETLDPAILGRIVRPPLDTCRRALTLLRDSPIKNWNIDIIAGLPRSSRTIMDDVQELTEVYQPPHMSVYMLESGRYPAEYGRPEEYEERAVNEYIIAAEYLRSA